MDKVNLGYSTKNIPIPSERNYMQEMIASAEKFIRNLRWRTHFFLNPKSKSNKKETYGFPSSKTPPHVPELKELEDGMLNIIQNIKFRKHINKFQSTLNKDIKMIKKSDKLLVAADKTTNFYRVDAKQYDKLLKSNITKDYKKAEPHTENDINRQDKEIAVELELDDRINTVAKKEAFISLKDHKPNFDNNPKCRLINPTKSEIGKISKKILERINHKVKRQTHSHQWKNTQEVIDWFKKIENTDKSGFICFDIVDFYPSISEEILTNALDFASAYTPISTEDRHIIMHTKKALLYHNEEPWCKTSQTKFDVTMGSYDGAETCELIGLYLLSQMKAIDINVGLYRDDGLAVCQKPPREIE